MLSHSDAETNSVRLLVWTRDVQVCLYIASHRFSPRDSPCPLSSIYRSMIDHSNQKVLQWLRIPTNVKERCLVTKNYLLASCLQTIGLYRLVLLPLLFSNLHS